MTIDRCDVVGLGENSVDLIYRVDGRLGPNAKLRIAGAQLSPGGQVATTACTCARLGLQVRYVGAFGSDENAGLIRQALVAHGVDIGPAVRRDAPNRHAIILLDERTGERTVLWARDPALRLRPADIRGELLTETRLLHVDNVDEETAITAARIARAAGAHVTTDIDTVGARTWDLIEAATFPILAEHVPAALTGEADPERSLRVLRHRHGGMLCVTLGARGSLLLAGERLYRAPAFDVHAVDTTGAGDVFRGALIYALLQDFEPASMLRFASAAAAISCTRAGAIGGVPALEEIEQFSHAPGARPKFGAVRAFDPAG